LTLGYELFNQNIVIAFKVNKSHFDTLLIDAQKEGGWLVLIIILGNNCKLTLLEVVFANKVVSQITEVLKKGALHEGNLIVYAGKLSYFTDEIQ